MRPGFRVSSRRRGWIAKANTVSALILLLFVADVAAGSAQVIKGRLLDEQTGQPVPGASVLLLDLEEDLVRGVLTDSAGRFSLEGPAAGHYRLMAERIGYRAVTSEPVELEEGAVLEVEFRLSMEAVPVAPIRVVGTRHPRLDRSGFYERRQEYGREGLNAGQFLERSEIERLSAMYVSDVLNQTRGVWAQSRFGRTPGGIRMRRGCTPDIYVNGRLFKSLIPGEPLDLDDRVSGATLLGVEVYTGYPLPVEYPDDDPGASACGVIVLWTGPS